MLIERVPEADGGLPWTAVISLGEAKRHLNVLHDDDDALIDGLVRVAQATLEGADGAGGTLGRLISQHTLDIKLPAFPAGRELAISAAPLVGVTHIKHLDLAGVEQTLTGTLYQVVPARDHPYVWLKPGAAWPATAEAPDAVRIRVVAGPTQCPADIGHAIKLHIGHLYLNREAVGESVGKLPLAYEHLLQPHRTHGWI